MRYEVRMASALLAALLLAAATTQSPTDGCPGVMVFFNSGSTRLDAAGIGLLDRLVPAVREMLDAGAWLRLMGSADDIGPAAANLVLSRRRAVTVRRHFVARGIRPDQLRIEAFGETRPLASFDGRETDAGVRAQNRNVTIAPDMPRALFERFFPPGGAVC